MTGTLGADVVALEVAVSGDTTTIDVRSFGTVEAYANVEIRAQGTGILMQGGPPKLSKIIRWAVRG